MTHIKSNRNQKNFKKKVIGTIYVGDDVMEKELSFTGDVNVFWFNPMENDMESPQYT